MFASGLQEICPLAWALMIVGFGLGILAYRSLESDIDNLARAVWRRLRGAPLVGK